MRIRYALAAVMLLAASASVTAQHIDILVWDDGGKLGVGEFDFDNATSADRRVQIGRLNGGDGPDAYTSYSPGFIALTGANALPGNKNLTWDFLPMTVDAGPSAGYRSTILYWDGDGASPTFGPAATDDYQFSISSFYGTAAASGQGQIEPGSVIAPTAPNGSIHEHPFFFLDDNGDGMNTTTPVAGIYLVALQLSIDDLESAEPVFMVWATPEIEILQAMRPAADWVNARLDGLVIDNPPGDYNGDGVVDAADYTVWRDSSGQTGGSLAADGNGDEIVDSLDYAIWRSNYGAPGMPSSTASALAVPEPLSCMLLTICLISVRRVSRRNAT